MSLTPQRLSEIAHELASRPGNEKVRVLVYDVLVGHLGVNSADIDFEKPMPEVHGRSDALLGLTVLEFKRNLRSEKRDAEEELTRYLGQRQRETESRFVGIATDGAQFLPYVLRDDVLVPLNAYTTDKDDPRALVVWLDSVIAVQEGLSPDADTVRKHLGKGTIAYSVARNDLGQLWAQVGNHPETALKRQLWADMVERVYG